MSLVRELESAFENGEMDDLKASTLPFIRVHRAKLLGFIHAFQAMEGPCPLDQLIKIFILQQNLPFDMRDYMTRQQRLIQREIGDCDCSEQRQRSVSEWIRKKASDHRSHSVFQQVFCFDRAKDELLPLIEEELGLVGMVSP